MIENMTNEQAAECLKTIHVLSFKDETATFFLTDVQNAFKLAIKALEQQPCEDKQDCEHCIHTYGTLGCCDMVNNKWIYDCDFGREQYKKEHGKSCEDCISREAAKELLKTEWVKYHMPWKDVNLSFVLNKINELPSVTPKSEYSWKEIKIKFECDDCISRQAVIQKINNKLNPCTDMFKCLEMSEIKEDVENLPSVKPTIPKGKWIILDECANEGVYCSECHKKVFKLEFSPTMKWRNFKYCPNCGAEMESEEV